MGKRGPKRERILFMDANFMEDAKVEKLTDGEFRAWMRMLSSHARYGEDSSLPGYAYGLSRRRIERLLEVGLLDVADGAFSIPNWDEWNGKKAYKRFLNRQRVRRHRDEKTLPSE